MSASQPNVSPLRQRMIDDMRMRQLAPKTQDIYLHIVRAFARFLGRSSDTATVEDLRRCQLYLVDHGTSAVSLNHAITGLKFFFTAICGHTSAQSRKIAPAWWPDTVGSGDARDGSAALIVNAAASSRQKGAHVLVTIGDSPANN